ncbi:MAG: FAD-dependent oxidoreductase [Thauera sp.]|nr:FAD-dependent oxidoreductase [Thauera sp.]
MNAASNSFDTLIIGAGVGGSSAAKSALSCDDTQRVLLVNEEEWEPYDRPPLSKDVLLGDSDTGDFQLIDETLRAHPRLVIKSGIHAAHLDPHARTVQLSDGSVCAYRSLIIATGSKARTLDPAIVDAGVEADLLYLKTLGDALSLRRRLADAVGSRLVVIGAGFIGLEVAAAARRLGCNVSVVEAGSRIVSRGAPALVAQFLRARHDREGVRFELGAQAERISRTGPGLEIRIEDGRRIHGDLVVAGIGTTANDSLAAAAGLECDNGILVDEFCRTSEPSIYAIGDVARIRSANLAPALRMEHWQAARVMGETAARNACGAEEPYQEVPWVWTDQYDLNLQFLGHTSDRSRCVIRGDVAAGKWTLFEKDGDALVAATLVNSGRDRRTIERLIARRTEVKDDDLSDPAFDLKALLR